MLFEAALPLWQQQDTSICSSIYLLTTLMRRKEARKLDSVCVWGGGTTNTATLISHVDFYCHFTLLSECFSCTLICFAGYWHIGPVLRASS